MGIIYRSFKARLYPNNNQAELINKTLGCNRLIYNLMLAERIKTYEALKDDKEALKAHKYKTEKQYKEENAFLKEVDSVSLQQSRLNLQSAYKNFYQSLNGKRKSKAGFPKFKKKRLACSYRTLSPYLRVSPEEHKVFLPKLGLVKYRNKGNPPVGVLKSATISRSATGKYFISALYECELELEPTVLSPDLKVKGLDMSMDKFYVDESGGSPEYVRLYRIYEKTLKKRQRSVSRKKLGSHNWRKGILRVSKTHERIANKRKDFTHKLSRKLVNENDLIVVEDINMRAMSQCLNLGKSVHDLGYGEFVRQLTYKALWSGKTLVVADRWFASSKTCNACGAKNDELRLSDRVWLCPSCGAMLDRDANAGRNLQRIGKDFFDLENIGPGRPEFKPVERKTAGGLSFNSLSHAPAKQELQTASLGWLGM